MSESTPRIRLILVSCVGCGRLHEPRSAMVFNPLCASCWANGTARPEPPPAR